jgi:hypothetical protein
MASINDIEIAGGFGYGYDQWPSDFDFHTSYSLYSNGASDRNPYLPIENEKMGKDWGASEFDASDPEVKTIYPYHDVYNDQGLWNAGGALGDRNYMAERVYVGQRPVARARERFEAPTKIPINIDSTNSPVFYSADPMVGGPTVKAIVGGVESALGQPVVLFLLFVLVVVLALLYVQDQKLSQLTNLVALLTRPGAG